jgi:hypothetical protein
LTKVQFADNFLDFAALGRPHINLARDVRGIWVRYQRSFKARHVDDVLGRLKRGRGAEYLTVNF